MTERKGHVPEVNLIRYRNLKGISNGFKSLAGRVSGLGEYEDANRLFVLERKYQDRANKLRVDLPEHIKKEID